MRILDLRGCRRDSCQLLRLGTVGLSVSDVFVPMGRHHHVHDRGEYVSSSL